MNTTVSNCRAVVYHYRRLTLSGNKPNLDIETIHINQQILSYECTKQLSSPSASFTLQVTATENWKRRVFTGDWIEVYLSNDGVETLRLLGNIDRVSQFTTKNDEGLLETSYVITGRDFGKVLEELEIWFNPFNTFKIPLSYQFTKGSPDVIINNLLSFFVEGKIPNSVLRKQPQFNQWVIPSILSRKYEGEGNRFGDILKRNIQKVSGLKTIKNLATLQGPVWPILEGNSNKIINELYLEMDDSDALVSPSINLRVRPFTTKNFRSGLLQEEINYFGDIERIIIQARDIIGTDIGVSDSERKNLFLLLDSNDLLNQTTGTALIQPQFPEINRASVLRNGLRVNYVETDYSLLASQGKNSKIKPRLLLEWNRLLFNHYNNAVFLEAGTISLVKANPKIRCGKCAWIKGTPGYINHNKLFYIEGYTDSWAYPGEWNQRLNLTRGIYVDSNTNRERYVFQVDANSSTRRHTGQTIVPLGSENDF